MELIILNKNDLQACEKKLDRILRFIENLEPKATSVKGRETYLTRHSAPERQSILFSFCNAFFHHDNCISTIY